ncbi:MAG: HAD family hydrolase [Anaerolineales bacterium]|nr:HAD family hydrolase [Anaerolineales bacterium]
MTLHIEKIRAICFDIDGTLRNTDDQYVQQIEKWLNPFRFFFANQNSTNVARRFVMAMEEPGNLLIQIPDRLGVDKPVTRFLDFLETNLFKKTHHNETIIPGVMQCLTFFQSRYPLCIVSARGQRQSLRFISHFELMPFFHCIATGQTTVHTKPYPDPIIWSSIQMGVAAEECLMVGDTTVDILAAKAAGAQSIGVLSGFGEENELRRAGADLILPSVADMTCIFN